MSPHLNHVLAQLCRGILFKSKGKSDVLLHLNAAALLVAATYTSRGIHPQHPRLPSGLWVEQRDASSCCVQVRPHVWLALDVDGC